MLMSPKKRNSPIAIIIHCSATPIDKDFTIEQIRQMHLQRGFTDIGYHVYIRKDGTICMGRKFEQIGAHCLGWNDRSIGICYEGGLLNGKPFDTRTPQQRISIEKAIRYCLTKYPLIKHVYGHNKFANKACPCFDAEAAYSYLVKNSNSLFNP